MNLQSTMIRASVLERVGEDCVSSVGDDGNFDKLALDIDLWWWKKVS